jgi:hypothetical protein
MTSIDDGGRTPARCFTEEEKDCGKKKKIELIHCGEVLILHGRRWRRSRASMVSGRSGGYGLATELLPGETRMTTMRSGISQLGWAGWLG